MVGKDRSGDVLFIAEARVLSFCTSGPSYIRGRSPILLVLRSPILFYVRFLLCQKRESYPDDAEESYPSLLQVLVCGEDRWRPEAFPGAVLAGLRVVVVVIAGLCLDALGRRRSVVAWMGLYFVVAFSRTFAPNAEAVVLCLTLEGAAAQASTLALLLLGNVVVVVVNIRMAVMVLVMMGVVVVVRWR